MILKSDPQVPSSTIPWRIIPEETLILRSSPLPQVCSTGPLRLDPIHTFSGVGAETSLYGKESPIPFKCQQAPSNIIRSEREGYDVTYSTHLDTHTNGKPNRDLVATTSIDLEMRFT
jgi:hypothetical protein